MAIRTPRKTLWEWRSSLLSVQGTVVKFHSHCMTLHDCFRSDSIKGSIRNVHVAGILSFWIGRFHMYAANQLVVYWKTNQWLVCTDWKVNGQVACRFLLCFGFWCLGIRLKWRGSSQWNVVWKAALTSHWELLFLIIMEIGHWFTCHHREYRDRQGVMYQPCPILAVIAKLTCNPAVSVTDPGKGWGWGKGCWLNPPSHACFSMNPLRNSHHMICTPPSQKLLPPLRESLIHPRVLSCRCLGVWGGSEKCALFDSQSGTTTLKLVVSCTVICSSCPEVP